MVLAKLEPATNDASVLRNEYQVLSAQLCGLKKTPDDPEEAMRRGALMDQIEARARVIEQDLASMGAAVWADVPRQSQSRSWCWLRVQWGKEQRAAYYLKESRVPCYWPNYPVQITVTRRAKNRWRQERLRPLIAGTLFVNVDEAKCEPWPVIDTTPGITGIVRAPDGYPLMVPQADIARIREIEAKENTPLPYAIHAFKLGQKVRFTEDTHSQWPPGIVARLYKNGRIGVDVTVLGRVALFDVHPHQIEAM